MIQWNYNLNQKHPIERFEMNMNKEQILKSNFNKLKNHFNIISRNINTNCIDCINCISCIDCDNCNRCKICKDCFDCVECSSCDECNNCFLCDNLYNEIYMILNVQFSKKEYFQKIESMWTPFE